MEILNRMADFKSLWVTACPHIAVPPDAQILRWATRFSDAELEHGVCRLAKKAAFTRFTSADDAGRYLTGVLVNEQKVRQ